MKKLLALFTLLPLLSWAFPVYTNRLDFDPAESTGQFDDFLWRWSGFDDQRVEFIFPNIDASSGVGFRLAYPQRGRTFLDILPPNVTSVFEVVTNKFPEIFTNKYTDIYRTTRTSFDYTNITITTFLTNGVFSRTEIVTNVVRPPEEKELVYVASSVVYTQDAFAITVPGYGLVTNSILNDTYNFTTLTTNSTFSYGSAISGRNFSNKSSLVTYYPQENAFDLPTVDLLNSLSVTSFTSYTPGRALFPDSFVEISTSTNIASFPTNSIYQFRMTSSIADTNYSLLEYAAFSFNMRNNITKTTNSAFYIKGDSSGTTLNWTTLFDIQTNNFELSLILKYRQAGTNFLGLESTIFSNLPKVSYSITAQEVSTKNPSIPVVESTVISNRIALATTTSVEFAIAPTTRVSRVYREEYFPATRAIFSIPRLSIPPDGPYFAEVLTYSGANPTNPTQSRTLAKGQVTVENSLWAITNYAGYTNYPGPWDYLLQDGSRPMTDDFDAGGYGVTNIGSPYIGFEDGTYISPSNVALWNSFIAGTGVSLTAGTVFDGQVTGVWNNLTLRKNALDNMEFLDLTTSPTGAAAVGRMVWNADRETYQFGMDAALTQDIGQQSFAQVKNAESVTISNGMVVYISGASGDRATVKIASYSNDTLSARTIGIAAEDIGPNGTGFVITGGPKYNQDTSAFSAGSLLWLGAYGNLTTNRPQAPLHGVFIGVAEKINANSGVVFVKVQNGFELDELHDINVSTPATNDLLIYNGTVWTNYARTNLSGIYLPLAGGTMTGNINMNEGRITNVSVVGLFSDSNRAIEFEDGTISGDYSVNGTWTFSQQPTIPGYLTSTGAAAIYATGTPLYVVGPEVVTTNNLSTIAGSGLGVTNNQLVVTNGGAVTFEELTGNRMLLGNGTLSFIETNAIGASQMGNFGNVKIGSAAYGASQRGVSIVGSMEIKSIAYGASQQGDFSAPATIGSSAAGAMQIGSLTSGSATNNAPGAIQLIGGGGTYLTTSGAGGSLLLGPGTNDVAYSVKASGGFYGPVYPTAGNAANLSNFPSSLLTVSAGNTNYARRTTVPASNTAFGSYNQWALDNTNLYFYNAASSKWLKVNGTLEW